MNDFFAKDANKALDQIKEALYDRLRVILDHDRELEHRRRYTQEECDFLQELIDRMERS
jgi:cob(I)alamin adenosyltransferase